LEREGVGGGLGGVGDGDDDAVVVHLLILARGQGGARVGAGLVDALAVDDAGDVGEVDPFEEAARGFAFGGEALEGELAVLDDGHPARREGADVGEAQVCEGDRFACCGKELSVDGPAHGTDSQRVAGDEHATHGVEEDDAVGAVEVARQGAHQLHQRAGSVAAETIGHQVHDDFGVGVEREVVLAAGEQAVAQVGVVGEGSVEGEAEPFPQAPVMALEGLGVARVVVAGGGVAGVADGGGPVVLVEDCAVLVRVRHAEDFADGADVLERVDDLRTVGVVSRHAGGELSAVLQVEQHARQEGGDVFDRRFRAAAASRSDGFVQTVERRHSALVVDVFTHSP